MNPGKQDATRVHRYFTVLGERRKGCSLVDLCIPKLLERTNAVADYVRSLWFVDANDCSNVISDVGRGEVSDKLLGRREQGAETCAHNRA